MVRAVINEMKLEVGISCGNISQENQWSYQVKRISKKYHDIKWRPLLGRKSIRLDIYSRMSQVHMNVL